MNASELPSKVSADTFGRALWDPAEETPPGLIGPDGKTAPKRFNVYRNNVIASLCEALQQSFPAVESLLGEDYFKALARAFVAAHPPDSPVLMWYGAEFGDFIGTFPPLQAYPYLADVARAEWAWLQAYHAADAEPLDPGEIGTVAPDDVGNVRFKMHPACRILQSGWPVWDLLRANRFDPAAEIAVDLEVPQSILITRPEFEVELMLLRPGGDVFVIALANGATLAEAAAAASGHAEAFSLSDTLSDCLANGVFTTLLTA